MSDQFISVREAAQTLGTSERKIMDLVEGGELQAYRIAGQFLRLKKSEVVNIRQSGTIAQESTQFPYAPSERFKDFLYFNDFYIASIVIIVALVALIFYV